MDLTFGHGTHTQLESVGYSGVVLAKQVTRSRLESSSSSSQLCTSPAYIVEQVILKECDNTLAKRRNITIRKDGVYHLLGLLETPLDHRPLCAELSSYLLPVATKNRPYLTVSKVPQEHIPVFTRLCKMNETNTTPRMSPRKFAICVTVAETQAWLAVKAPFAAVIQLNLAVQVPDLGTILSISPPTCSHITHL